MIRLRLFAHHNGVDQVAGNGDAFRMQRAFRHAIFHLRQHLRPIASGGENRVQNFQLHHLFIGREVALFISMGAAHNNHVQRNGRVEQIFVAAKRHVLDQIGPFAGAGVHPPAFHARIDKGTEPDGGKPPGKPGGHRAIEMDDLPLRQAPGFHFVVVDHRHPARRQAPVRADKPRHHTRMGEVLDAALAIALPSGMQQRQVARFARGQKARFDSA